MTITDPTACIQSSIELGEILSALSLAQGEMTDPPKNKTAKVPMKTGGSYSYKYADLADLLKIIRPIFTKHGLSILQFAVNPRHGSVTIITRIGHKSGQWMESGLTLPVGDDKPQTLGSAITYGRRYSVAAAAGLSPDEDEDGQVAQSASPGSRSREEMKQDRHTVASATQAAENSLKADLAKPPKPRLYNAQYRPDQDWLIKQMKVKEIPEIYWDNIGNALNGRLPGDLTSVVTEVLAQ